MEEAYKIVREKTANRKKADKTRWDAKFNLTVLQPGDRVLVQNKEKGGPGKLRSFWEQAIYVVKKEKGSQGMVYEVCREDKTGRTRVLHRNMLLPVGGLVLDQLKKTSKRKVNEQDSGATAGAHRQDSKVSSTVQPFNRLIISEEDSSSSSDIGCIPLPRVQQQSCVPESIIECECAQQCDESSETSTQTTTQVEDTENEVTLPNDVLQSGSSLSGTNVSPSQDSVRNTDTVNDDGRSEEISRGAVDEILLQRSQTDTVNKPKLHHMMMD